MKIEYKFDKKAMLLLVSDVHIGALRTNISLFNDFLRSLIEGLENRSLENLKALIILGDCFDLIMDTHEDFFEYKIFDEILENFNSLHEREEFNLVFALGNHEVSVKNDYDKTFSTERSDLVNEFNKIKDKLNRPYTFFNDKIFSQYVIIKNDESNEPQLLLYDTKEEIAKGSKIKPIPLKIKAPEETDHNILLCHGFQFDPNLSYFSGIWHFCLKVTSKIIKEIADGIWNGFFKVIYKGGQRLKQFVEDKIKSMIDETSRKYVKKNKLTINKQLNTEIYTLIMKKLESDLKRDKIETNKPFNEHIYTEFIPTLKRFGYNEDFSHIIFGHTHRRRGIPLLRKKRPEIQRFEGSQMEDTKILNTGAWQHVDFPSFIQINTDWEFKLGTIEKKVSEIENKIIKKPLSGRTIQDLSQKQKNLLLH